jgi:hypothetical protein
MKSLCLTAIIMLATFSFAQRVPKEASVGLSGDYTVIEEFNRSPIGLGISIRYGWQVGGLDSEYQHFLDIPMMLTYVPSTSQGTPNSFLMRYGWSTRHYLSPRSSGGFYLSYGLFLNQVWEWDKVGRILGHETLLSAGYDLPSEGPFFWYFQVNGRYATFWDPW